MQTTKVIDFKTPYNNKLRCDCFTTIQMADAAFKKGAVVEISLEGYKKGEAKIIGLSNITLPKVSDWVARLDSSCTAKEFVKRFKEDFSHRPAINWNTEPLVYLLLKWEGKGRMNSLFTEKQ